MDPELNNLIQQARTAGMSEKEIKEALLKAGWESFEIDRTLKGVDRVDYTKTPETQAVHLKEKEPFPFLKVILIVIFVLLILGSAFAFWYFDKKNQWGIITPRPLPEVESP